MRKDISRGQLKKPSGPDDVTLRFSGALQEAYGNLYSVLLEHPEFDPETRARVKTLSDGSSRLHLPTIFAMVVQIAAEGTECAVRSGDKRISAALDDVLCGFTGIDDDRPAIRINRGTLSR